MNDRFIDTVYQSVIGQLQPQHHLEGVEDLFAPGCPVINITKKCEMRMNACSSGWEKKTKTPILKS